MCGGSAPQGLSTQGCLHCVCDWGCNLGLLDACRNVTPQSRLDLKLWSCHTLRKELLGSATIDLLDTLRNHDGKSKSSQVHPRMTLWCVWVSLQAFSLNYMIKADRMRNAHASRQSGWVYWLSSENVGLTALIIPRWSSVCIFPWLYK